MKHSCPDCKCSEILCAESHCTHVSYDGIDFCCRCDYRRSLEAGWISDSSMSWPRPGCELQFLVG